MENVILLITNFVVPLVCIYFLLWLADKFFNS